MERDGKEGTEELRVEMRRMRRCVEEILCLMKERWQVGGVERWSVERDEADVCGRKKREEEQSEMKEGRKERRGVKEGVVLVGRKEVMEDEIEGEEKEQERKIRLGERGKGSVKGLGEGEKKAKQEGRGRRREGKRSEVEEGGKEGDYLVRRKEESKDEIEDEEEELEWKRKLRERGEGRAKGIGREERRVKQDDGRRNWEGKKREEEVGAEDKGGEEGVERKKMGRSESYGGVGGERLMKVKEEGGGFKGSEGHVNGVKSKWKKSEWKKSKESWWRLMEEEEEKKGREELSGRGKERRRCEESIIRKVDEREERRRREREKEEEESRRKMEKEKEKRRRSIVWRGVEGKDKSERRAFVEEILKRATGKERRIRNVEERIGEARRWIWISEMEEEEDKEEILKRAVEIGRRWGVGD